ncbi:MAG TPA: hypothetical protein DIC51_00990 [Coxiellaceae bacterium]|nr:hypothetical protein [Coxiellaceae bacterium]
MLKISGNPTQQQIELQQVATDLESGKLLMNAMLLFRLLAKYEPALLATGKYSNSAAIINGQKWLTIALFYLLYANLLSTHKAQINFDTVMTTLQSPNGQDLANILKLLTKSNLLPQDAPDRAQANFDAIITILKTQYGNHLIKIFGLITPSTNLLSANTPDRTQANFESITAILNGQNAAHLYVVLYFLKQSTLLSASNAQSNFDAVIHLLNRPDGQYLASILTGLIQAGLLPTSAPAEAQTNFQAVMECSNLAFLHEELTTHDKSAAQYQSVLSSMKRFSLFPSTISSADRTPASQAAASTPAAPSSTHSA